VEDKKKRVTGHEYVELLNKAMKELDYWKPHWNVQHIGIGYDWVSPIPLNEVSESSACLHEAANKVDAEYVIG